MKRIFITAGHHNRDSGAVGNGYQENKLTQELRGLITAKLREIACLNIWNDNDDDTLAQVITKIKQVATADDFLLEIHFDSADRAAASGTTALVATGARDKSKDFAKQLANDVAAIVGITNRGVKDETESNRGRLGILHTKASSCLLEIAFISNPKDMERYQIYKESLALAIATTIRDTLAKY